MKRLRVERWAGQLQPPRNPRTALSPKSHINLSSDPLRNQQQRCHHSHYPPRHQPFLDRRPSSTSDAQWLPNQRLPASYRRASSMASETVHEVVQTPLHSPGVAQIRSSAKLAALHARLSLPAKLPLETLARCLVDSTVDERPGFSNAPLARLGQDLLAFYTSEYLLCNYPRLPMSVLFAAQYAYVGPATLNAMRAEWGVEVVAAPGPEVDPGLLQLHRLQPGNALAPDGMHRVKDVRTPQRIGIGQMNERWHHRRGMGMRIVQDDEFGDAPEINEPFPGAPISIPTDSAASPERANSTGSVAPSEPTEPATSFVAPAGSPKGTTVEKASASFVRALTGALHLHAGAEASKAFHQAHITSRQLQLEKIFNFPDPVRDLSTLCKREAYELPVARLISETGRLSRTPVFVVGVYSGSDRLGEGAGSSLNEARTRAAAAALRAWYLYSPPKSDIVLPSDVDRNAFPRAVSKIWKPQMIDLGEIVT